MFDILKTTQSAKSSHGMIGACLMLAEDHAFKSKVRATRQFGEWAATQLSLTEQEIKDYADWILQDHILKPDVQDVIRKVRADFNAVAIKMTDRALNRHYQRFLQQALAEAA